MQPTKTIDDLPKFTVVNSARTESTEEGYLRFRFYGNFDKIETVRDGPGWLLLPKRQCLYGGFASLDLTAKTAIFNALTDEDPQITGQTLPYLYGYLQAYHVWMVVEPLWEWTEVTFTPADATAKRVPACGESIGSEPVKGWIEVKRVGDTWGRSKVMPESPENSATRAEANSSWIIPSGWDHEHCELCSAHIESGDVGHIDSSEHWVCKSCYSKYVSRHDLSFLFS